MFEILWFETMFLQPSTMMFTLINYLYFLIVYEILALSITNVIVDQLEHPHW
jgi:hypothetical protein